MSPGRRLTPDAERLIARHIDSVGALDLLLLLRGDERRTWMLDDVCAELRCPPDWARRRLETLRRGGLAAARDGGYRYAPDGARTRAAVAAVARAWQHDRREVTALMLAPRGRPAVDA